MKFSPSYCVIIPMYNEEKGVVACIAQVMQVVTKLPGKAILLVINDGSTDLTLARLRAQKRKYKGRLQLVSYDDNRGYGGALAKGIERANSLRFTYGIVMDSDLTNDPKDIPRFIKAVRDGRDCVKASRYVRGGGTSGVPYSRQIISEIGNTIAASLFDMKIKDCTNGFCLFRLDIFRRVKLTEPGFAIILEMLYWMKKYGARCIEIPIVLTARTDTQSHFSYNLGVFWSYLRWALKASTLSCSN